MTHFLKCHYEETYPDGVHIYTFKGECEETGVSVNVELFGPDLFKYNQGELIQNAFPYIDANHREWMMTGRLAVSE